MTFSGLGSRNCGPKIWLKRVLSDRYRKVPLFWGYSALLQDLWIRLKMTVFTSEILNSVKKISFTHIYTILYVRNIHVRIHVRTINIVTKWRSIISTRVCLKPNFVAICLCINMYTDEYSIVNTKTSLWVSLFMFAYHYTSCNMSRIKNNDWSLVKLYLYIPRKFSKYFGQ